MENKIKEIKERINKKSAKGYNIWSGRKEMINIEIIYKRNYLCEDYYGELDLSDKENKIIKERIYNTTKLFINYIFNDLPLEYNTKEGVEGGIRYNSLYRKIELFKIESVYPEWQYHISLEGKEFKKLIEEVKKLKEGGEIEVFEYLLKIKRDKNNIYFKSNYLMREWLATLNIKKRERFIKDLKNIYEFYKKIRKIDLEI